jgi:hypothetical protein
MNEFRQVKEEAMRAYTMFRKRTDPYFEIRGNNSHGHNVWDKLATLLMDMDVHPMEYIRIQFLSCTEGDFPFPNILISARAISQYKLISGISGGSLGVQIFERQTQRLQKIISNIANGNADKIILDRCMDFSPVFRMIMCSDEAYDKAYATWGEQALRQLDFDVMLAEYLDDKYHDRTKQLRPSVSVECSGTPVTEQPVSVAPGESDLLPRRLRPSRT